VNGFDVDAQDLAFPDDEAPTVPCGDHRVVDKRATLLIRLLLVHQDPRPRFLVG